MTQRFEQLKDWIEHELELVDYELQPASSDASFRRYYRLTPNTSQLVRFGPGPFIIMDAPPYKENCEPYLHVAKLLGDIGVNVPQVFVSNLESGFLLLSDLGSTQYLSVLNKDNVEGLYDDALNALLTIQQKATQESSHLPAYDEALLSRELEIFREWYLQKHLGLRLSQQQNEMLDNAYALLIESALAQPKVFVHRDYHSRNLMKTAQFNPGILDFQDAVMGPFTYDLVSLLRDCYIQWPRERVMSWASGYMQRAHQLGIIEQYDADQCLRWFDLMGAQRHLKAVGIFARLEHRDGKSNYLDDIPRTLSYVVDVSQRHDYLQPLHQFLVSIAPTLATDVC